MAELTADLNRQSKEAVSLIQKSGVKLIPKPSGSDLEEFYKVHGEVANELTGEIYPKELLERVYAILDNIRNK
ncbi:MAG: hypothetical protein JRJ06_09335 [Deltaproteobacteria bacterium]|nr:hypothetical protein [Deltaproteobacteria bacterium]